MISVKVLCPKCEARQRVYMLNNSDGQRLRKKLGQTSINLVEKDKHPCLKCQAAEKTKAVYKDSPVVVVQENGSVVGTLEQ